MDEEKKVLSDKELEEINGGIMITRLRPNDVGEDPKQDDSLSQENAYLWPRG